MIFTDEWGGGTRPRCRATDLLELGRRRDLRHRRSQAAVRAATTRCRRRRPNRRTASRTTARSSRCPGRDIMVQAWYQGGVSVFDFTDSAHPVEIAFFDRGPLDAKKLITGGFWSAYWYNGNIYGTEIARGLDIFKLHAERVPVAERDRRRERWFASTNSTRSISSGSPGRRRSVVARAYLDQLARSKGISSSPRAGGEESALERADRIRSAVRQGGDRRRRGAQLPGRCDLETDAGPRLTGRREPARSLARAKGVRGRMTGQTCKNIFRLRRSSTDGCADARRGTGGALPFTPEMLRERPSGDLFGWSQNAGMGWDPAALGGKEFLILSTHGGIRAPDGTPDRPRLSHRSLGSRPARWKRRRAGVQVGRRGAVCRRRAPIRATAGRRARRRCSTACRSATMRRRSSAG